MTVNIDTPVDVIEGIGPATASALAQHGIHYVLDLFRLSPESLHALVESMASLEQARSWRVMASLMEVRPVTAQWAEALVKGGIGPVETLSRLGLHQVEAIFSQAMSDRIIADSPSLEEIAEMIRNAAVIFYSGALMGTVLDSDQTPVVGVTIRLGGRETETNNHGRFRLANIALGNTPPLFLWKDGYSTLGVEQPPISSDPDTIAVYTFRLTTHQTDAQISTRLSEFSGDKLPPASGYTIRTERIDASALRKGDVLMIQKFYKREPDALLLPRFRDYENGEFILTTVRVARSALPSSIKEKSHVKVTDQGFLAIEFGPQRQQINLALRRFNRLHPPSSTTPISFDESRALTSQRIEFLKAEGILGRPPQPARNDP